MSMSLNLTAADLGALADFIDRLGTATIKTGCQVAVYGRTEVQLPGTSGVVRIRWDDSIPAYVIDDTVGD